MSREPIGDRMIRGAALFFEWIEQKAGMESEPKKRTRLPGELGPWYQTGIMHRITDVPSWVSYPEQPLETDPCPGCGEQDGHALLWLPGAAHLARFQCSTPGCRRSWIDPQWARADVAAWLLREQRQGYGPVWNVPQEETDAALQELAEFMRYEAGTDRHDRRNR